MRITRRPSIVGVPGVPSVEDAGAISLPSSPASSPAGRARETPATSDRVDVSEAARLRQRLRAEVGDLDLIATDRVAELRGQVSSGRFQPPARVVAERLLADLAADLLV